MDFSYVASGVFQLIGCSEPNAYSIFVYPQFTVGEYAYTLDKALKGKLEKVMIKKINVVDQYSWNYKDTLNRLWLEREMLTLEEAQEFIESYDARKHIGTVLRLKTCKATLRSQ